MAVAELPEDAVADAVWEYRDKFKDYPPWWAFHSGDPAKTMRDAIKKGEALPEEQSDDEFAVKHLQ